MQPDAIFEEEQHHLSQTFDALQTMGRELEEKMIQSSKNAAADKLAMCDEVSPNFSSETDAMETYADYAIINQVVDAHNMSQSVDAEKLSSIRQLLHQPYFAKVVLQFKSGQEPRELYIGAAGVSDDMCKRLVIDWRSPVAEVYYNQDNGKTSYKANGCIIDVELLLRRQFDIEADTLHAYFDTNVAIQDALLLSSLSKTRTAQMQSITATIQKEQNLVIRHDDVPALLVNGIAGSGKTSVLMQRIAYLFYQQRGTLDPSEVFLITPNPVFQKYIDNVLPDLGESNPECLTWEDFASQVMPVDRSRGKLNVPLEVFNRIEEACDGLTLQENDFKEVKCEGKRFLSPAQINQVAGKFKNIPAGPHLMTLVREELYKRVESRLKQEAATDEILDEIACLSPDQQIALFHETFNAHDEDEARSWAQRFVELRYADALKAVEQDEWVRVDRIGMRLLGVENLSPTEWLYLKMTLTGLGNPDAKYVMIDEVQDYTAAQLRVLARYFRRAHFLLLGDENQAISPDTAHFDEVRAVFEQVRGSVDECLLLTSYRSSPEITALFASLADEERRMNISSIQRPGIAPEVHECADGEACLAALKCVIRDARNSEGLTAVVVPQSYLAKKLHAQLGDNAPMLIDVTMALPERGVIMLPLKLAKGLEFDQVIIPDATERVFPDTPLARKCLYTTISRATRKITLIAQGGVTPILSC